MAWHPKTFPWDWDTGEGLLQQHHGGKRSSESACANEADACLGVCGGAQNGAVCSSSVYGLGSSNASFNSASSSLHGMLASGAPAGESNFACLEQRRLPVTINAGAGSSFDVHCSDAYQSNSPQREKAEFLELRSQPSSAFAVHKKAATSNTEKNGDLNVVDRFRQKNEPQGSLFLPAGVSGQDDKEATRAHSTEEQHSSTATGSAGSGDSLTGLHLGKRPYFEDTTGSVATNKGTQKTGNSAPPKRPRAASGGGVQTPKCQVEGCKIDLTSAKGYHRRHKVCEVHSKAEKVTVANQEQRFCQQCSRFHVLAEFDEVKRSCRRRLAGHNERRRKPQPHTFALNARFPSTFPEWPSFFRHPRFMGMSAPWEDSGKISSIPWKGAWPRMMRFEDQRSFDCAAQASGMERQLFLAGLSPQPNDKLPLLLLQSPKGIICMPNDQRAHGYLGGSIGPMNNGLMLSCSSGAGVLSGLEVTPAATQVVTKVTDSGRALSLLSAQTPGSTAPDAVSLDLSTGTSVMVDQFMSEDHTAGSQQLVKGGQQHYFDYAAEKMLSIASNVRNHSIASNVSAAGMSSIEKDHYAGSLIHDFNGAGGCEGHPFLSTLQGHETRVPQDMQILSLPQNGQPWGSSMAFTSCPFEDLQSSYEPSFLDSQQRI